MTRQQPRICDRDAFGKERKATQRRTACLEGVWHEWYLCEEHAEQWDREMFSWARVGQETDPPLPALVRASGPKLYNDEFNERARRAAELRAKQEPNRALKVVDHAHQPELLDVSVPPGERHPNGWLFTPHADTRAKERGYSIEKVLDVVTRPNTTYQDTRFTKSTDQWIYQDSDCAVVVNPEEKVIITVLHRDRARYALDAHRHAESGRMAQ
jgi:glutathionyl-hydroquinone reductase